VVPPLVALYRFASTKTSWITHIILLSAGILIQFLIVYGADVGGSMIMNDEFFAKVFMNPFFHFSSFMYGISMALIYIRFKSERGYQKALSNSFSSRMMELVRHNNTIRYVLYLIALSCMVSSLLW
jgi:hypothetical protein